MWAFHGAGLLTFGSQTRVHIYSEVIDYHVSNSINDVSSVYFGTVAVYYLQLNSDASRGYPEQRRGKRDDYEKQWIF